MIMEQFPRGTLFPETSIQHTLFTGSVRESLLHRELLHHEIGRLLPTFSSPQSTFYPSKVFS